MGGVAMMTTGATWLGPPSRQTGRCTGCQLMLPGLSAVRVLLAGCVRKVWAHVFEIGGKGYGADCVLQWYAIMPLQPPLSQVSTVSGAGA